MRNIRIIAVALMAMVFASSASAGLSYEITVDNISDDAGDFAFLANDRNMDNAIVASEIVAFGGPLAAQIATFGEVMNFGGSGIDIGTVLDLNTGIFSVYDLSNPAVLDADKFALVDVLGGEHIISNVSSEWRVSGVVPEPGSLALISLALMGLFARKRQIR